MPMIADYIDRWPTSPFADVQEVDAVGRVAELVAGLLDGLGDEYLRDGSVACHRSAEIEPGAAVKAPAVIGPRCFVARGSLVRGGCWLDEDCVVGPGAELKSTIMFRGSTLAHFNFVGDSILGEHCNLEAGAVIANRRNEHADVGTEKRGALVGDRTRIGANAVVAPGAILPRDTIVGRLALVDQGGGAAPGAGRRLISSGSSFERDIGYSRAVVDGDWVFVSGTTGFDYGAMTISDEVAEQAEQCLVNIAAALREAGASLADVVRARYILPVRDDFPSCWPALKRAFGEVRPAATMMVAGLADPRMKIEIEVTARRRD